MTWIDGWGLSVPHGLLSSSLVMLGLVLVIGAVAGDAVERLKIPWITGAIVAGVVIGPGILDLVDAPVTAALHDFTRAALAVIAFNIGSAFDLQRFRTLGRTVLVMTCAVVTAPVVLVCIAERALGLALPFALLLAAIAPATAPTTTYAVVRDRGAKGPFVDLLLGVLAVNDMLTVILFSAVSAVVIAMLGAHGDSDGIGAAITSAIVGEATSIGAGAALAIAFLGIRRSLRRGAPDADGRSAAILAGFLVVAIGAATVTGLSPLLVPLTFGAVVANATDPAERGHLHALTSAFETPLFIIFFVLAGTRLPIAAAEHMALLTLAIAYVAARFAGKYGAAFTAATALRVDPGTRTHLGLCFPSQGALTMGLILAFRGSPAVQSLDPRALATVDTTVSVVLVAVLISQLFGPLLIDVAVRRGATEAPDTGAQPPVAKPG